MSGLSVTTRIPPYTGLLLPLLQLMADRKERRLSECITALADYLGLDETLRQELTPSGKQVKFNYRVQVASMYLRRAGLMKNTSRGVMRVTPLGLEVLKTRPLSIDRAFLRQFPGFVDFVTRSQVERAVDAETTEYLESEHTPKELIHLLHTSMQKDLAEELLDIVLASSPAFFEKLVVDLLLAMGYGSSREKAGRALGRTGDGGVDGVIQEDKLGLDVVYVQAKRYARQNSVGRPLVQAFIGSLIGKGASRGVMMTTSRYSKEAVDYARSMQNHKVILIDGEQLTHLMIEHNVGVDIEETYTLKRLDRDYFEID